MNNPEARSRHTRPIPYGEFGGPFFDPVEIERISRGGKRPVDFFGFLSAHGLDVKPEEKESVVLLLKQTLGNSGLQPNILLQNEDKKTTFFRSRDIRVIEKILSYARFEMIPYFEDGIENFNLLGQWVFEIRP